MKIKTNKLVFGAALKDVSRAVSAKNPHPALSGIKFTADKDVTLTGSDLELTVIRTVPAEVIEPGGLVLPVRIVELIDKLPSGMFTIESKDMSGLIKYGDSEAVLNGYSVDEYPELPTVKDEVSFEVSGENLKDAIFRIAYMAADQHSNAVLCGVSLEVSDNILTLAAVDGHRLGCSPLELSTKPGDIQTVIPKKAVLEIVKLLKSSDKITVVIGENTVAFQTEGMSIMTRVLTGKYPAYKNLVPTEYKAKVKLNTLQLKDSVERASLVNNNGTPIVTIDCAGEKLVVSQNSECGKLREEISVEIEGEEFKQNFNAKYLIEMLKYTPSDEIQLAYTGNLSPLVLLPGDQKAVSIVLPVRTA